ncbi:hypothetical protein RRF57_010638 [Xylaria bambusicola]|uniref:Uncharacterized protein n=1 Tax=Xylaria bambusicola TaxID=326684 RepID=A0AAN7ZCQ0_9PEZI
MAVILDSKMPGATVTQRMPYRARSLVIGRVIEATAPLLAAYATCPFCPSNAATDATTTTSSVSNRSFSKVL